MRILVKISGDLIGDRRVIGAVRALARNNHLTIIHGAGTQISKALERRGIQYKFVNGIRHTTKEGLRICFEESRKARQQLEQRLRGFNVEILSPVSKIGNKIINKNAEQVFMEMHKNFVRKIVFTASAREKPLLAGVGNVEIIKLAPKPAPRKIIYKQRVRVAPRKPTAKRTPRYFVQSAKCALFGKAKHGRH